jgi:hypothetical protein
MLFSLFFAFAPLNKNRLQVYYQTRWRFICVFLIEKQLLMSFFPALIPAASAKGCVLISSCRAI